MRQQRAFTLVELLVVIGIIALLIATLMPALNTARRAAQMTVCLSNQRQLVLALIMYTQENKGYFPGGEVVGSPDRFYAWYDPTSHNPYSVNRDPSIAPTFLAKYVSNTKDIARCPAVPSVKDTSALWFEPATTYWYPNSLLLTPEQVRNVWTNPPYPAQRPQKIGSVKYPTKKVVIIDYETWHQPVAMPINLIAPGVDATGQQGRRGVPMGFADGHAAAHQTSDMTRPDVNWTGHYPDTTGEYGVEGKDVW